MCRLRSSRAAEGSAETCALRLRLWSIACWKSGYARASAPISSARPACGTSTFSSPSATRLMVEVMADRGRGDRTGDDDDADHDQQQGDAAEAGQDKRQFAW